MIKWYPCVTVLEPSRLNSADVHKFRRQSTIVTESHSCVPFLVKRIEPLSDPQFNELFETCTYLNRQMRSLSDVAMNVAAVKT